MRRLRWTAGAALLVAACSSEEKPGAAVVMYLDTDMEVPENVEQVGLYIQHVKDGRSEIVLSQEAKPVQLEDGHWSVEFAATFVVQAGLDPKSDQIRTRFVGYHADGTVAAMREARTAMPTTDVRQLRLPLLFINEGRVVDSQAGVATTAAAGLGFTQVQDGARGDVFTRFRHPECKDDETLGDLGTCESIDVVLAPPDPDAETKAEPACLPVPGCFGGDRGVRSLPIDGCKVSIEGLGGTDLALGLPGGYDAGNGRSVQPIDAALYTYNADRTAIELGTPLCDRATKDGIGSVWVSARCAPKTIDVAICAPYRTQKTAAQPDDTVTFPGDPDLPEAGPGEAGLDSGDPDGSDGEIADAGEDADTGTPEDTKAFTRAIAVDTAGPMRRINAFAMVPDGRTWFLTEGDDTLAAVTAAGHDDTNVPLVGVESPFGENAVGSLTLGVDQSAYYVAGQFSNAWVLEPNANAYEQVRYGADCETQSPSFFTVGQLNGSTIAMYGGSSGLPQTSGDVVAVDRPDCFRQTTEFDAGSDVIGRGDVFDGDFFVPRNDNGSFMLFSNNAGAREVAVQSYNPTPLDSGDSLRFASLVDVGNGDAIALGIGRRASEQDRTVFYLVQDQEGPAPVEPMLTELADTRPSREAFGHDGVMCARLESSFTGNYASVKCLKQVDGEWQHFELGNDSEGHDLHVYGDATYLYLGKMCFELSNVTGIQVRATPWAEVDDHTADDLLETCGDYVSPA